jgi:hypothetical protein
MMIIVSWNLNNNSLIIFISVAVFPLPIIPISKLCWVKLDLIKPTLSFNLTKFVKGIYLNSLSSFLAFFFCSYSCISRFFLF